MHSGVPVYGPKITTPMSSVIAATASQELGFEFTIFFSMSVISQLEFVQTMIGFVDTGSMARCPALSKRLTHFLMIFFRDGRPLVAFDVVE